MEEDMNESYRSEDQPQYIHVYNGMSKISQCRSLQKHVDVDIKKSDAKDEEQKVPVKESHPKANQKGCELRNKVQAWSESVSI